MEPSSYIFMIQTASCSNATTGSIMARRKRPNAALFTGNQPERIRPQSSEVGSLLTRRSYKHVFTHRGCNPARQCEIFDRRHANTGDQPERPAAVFTLAT